MYIYMQIVKPLSPRMIYKLLQIKKKYYLYAIMARKRHFLLSQCFYAKPQEDISEISQHIRGKQCLMNTPSDPID